MDYDQLLEGCGEVGARMLGGGAEIYRVEDTVRRIYGDEDFPDKVAVRCGERGEPIPEETTPDFFCQQLCGVRHRCARSGLCIDGGTM